jgi:hypothetical protein
VTWHWQNPWSESKQHFSINIPFTRPSNEDLPASKGSQLPDEHVLTAVVKETQAIIGQKRILQT